MFQRNNALGQRTNTKERTASVVGTPQTLIMCRQPSPLPLFKAVYKIAHELELNQNCLAFL